MHSVFFRRIVLGLAIAMLLAAVVMLGGYVFISRDVYSDIKLGELQSTVGAVCELAYEYTEGNISKELVSSIVGKLFNEEDTAAMVFDARRSVIYFSDEVMLFDVETAQQEFSEQITRILAGESVSSDNFRSVEGKTLMLLGTPVKNREGDIIGGVIIARSMEGINGTVIRLSVALLWMAALAIPVGLLGLSLRVRAVTEPLNKMSDAAVQMTHGNFDIRLDESETGEIGVLAHALNNLCSELSHTIKQLSFEKGQLNQILQGLSDGVAAVNERGELMHYNAALMQMFGAVDVARKTDLISDETIWNEYDEVFTSGEPRTISYKMPGDRVLWISLSPVTDDNMERIGVVGLFKDMTEMEKLEATRREYVANVSHELRTPLTAVRGLLEPLADGMVKDEEDRQRYYKIMLHEVMRLSRLITDMMTLSRLQSGTEYMDLSKVDVYDLVNDIASGYSSTVAGKGVHLVVDCPNPIKEGLTDPDRIEQVVVILLDNALRYTPENGTITIGLRDTKKRIELTVTDTGCGIPEADLPHIFERFYKVDKSRGSGGTGLGLSIAGFIMEKLGESIKVESKLGAGTRFTLTIKHYTDNAIALGPVGEKTDRYGDEAGRNAAPAEIEQEAKDTDEVLDAQYEILNEGKNEKKGEKRNEKKNDRKGERK